MVTIDMDKTGKRIKEIRKKSGMTIKQVQDACGISAAAVCKWQNGQAAYSARTAHPFQRNGAPFRFKLSKAQQVD